MILIFLIGAVLISLGLFFNKNGVVNYILLGLFAVLLWVLGIYEYQHMGEVQYEFFKPDALGLLMLFPLAIVSIPAFYHGYRYILTRGDSIKSRSLFFSAMVLLLTACAAAYLSNHIAVIWIFVEITTLSASVLIYHHRTMQALEGVWKYVFICAISITFVYIGILFLSLAMKKTGMEDMTFDALLSNYDLLDPFWLRLSFLFIFTGFTAKLGLVPMYTAGIDAKDKAPAPSGALLASVLMNLGFVGIYRTYSIISLTPLREWTNMIILIAAVLSIFVATVYMTRIKNIKRMFAYSGIEHMGLVMLGLAAGGIGVYAAILHVVLHTFVKSSLFFQFSQIYRVFRSKSIYDVGHYFKYNRAGALVVLLGFISATAMPPSGLFVSEFLIFQSLFQAHYIILLLAVLLLLTFIIWGFGSNVFKLLFTPPVNFDESQAPKISAWESLPQFILLALAIYIAYNPPAEFVTLIEDAVKLIS